ncbi:MAG: DNA-directed RNA polymerase [Aeromonas popoffii]|uniref:DNA-directed RNA polymerase n=1 Tax=Aeromonas popoffii TaxID=70856 RepID=UPI003F2C3763
MTSFNAKQLATKQVELEYHMRSVGIARLEANEARNVEQNGSSTLGNTRLINEVTEQLADMINAYLNEYAGKRGAKPAMLGLIQQVGSKEAAIIALKSSFDMMTGENMHITGMAARVGARLEDQIRFSHLEAEAPHYVQAILESMAKKGTNSYSHKARTLKQAESNIGVEYKALDKGLVCTAGAFLIDLISQLEFKGQPLFTSKMVYVSPTKTETAIELSEFASDWVELFKDEVALSRPAYAPCVVPPQLWTSPTTGGFHVPEIAATMPLIHGKKKHTDLMTYDTMPKVYEAVNAYQACGWVVEKRVVDTLGAILRCKLPLAVPQHEPLTVRPAPIPEALQAYKGKEMVSMMTEAERNEFFAWKADAVEIEAKERIRKVDLAQTSMIYREAMRYSKFPEMWFVPYMDYRQRLYCTSTVLTPQGGDLQKGMLRFSEKTELGFSGLYWLAVQGANVWAKKNAEGVALDKEPFMVRARTVLEPAFIEMATSIASDPWSNTEWCDADKPWQFLNWCFEMADLVDHVNAGNSWKTFKSNLVIAQDGSCSGTQHYSMLLKNEESGRLVNLLPCEKPNDIYGSAADGFITRLEAILEDSNSAIADKLAASSWLNHANRNLLKPPVMTLVYGSAAMTCRKTTIDYLLDLQSKEDKAARAGERKARKMHDFESESKAASWATPLIWSAVGDVQRPAKEGMKFIKSVAKFVSKNGKPMVCTAPTGFKMTQEQFKQEERRVRTVMFGGTRITIREATDEIDGTKMQSSSAPNFVHLMDSSHLLLTTYDFMVTKGHKSLALIHDSFGTQASNVRALRRSLVKQLVEMYDGTRIMEKFLAENEMACLDESEIEVPALGTLDYEEVKKARYPFG